VLHGHLRLTIPPVTLGFNHQGPNFRKILWQTSKKDWFTKNLGWACDYQKYYEKLRTQLCNTYEKITTLRVYYENVKFAASEVIRETLGQRLLLVEYFEIKITDNESDDLLRMLSKKWITIFLKKHFPKKILGSRISLTYPKIFRRT